MWWNEHEDGKWYNEEVRMQIKINSKRITAGLVLCFLILTNQLAIFDMGRFFPSDAPVTAAFSANTGNEDSAVDSGFTIGSGDYLAVTNASREFPVSPTRQARWLGTKDGFHLLAIIITAQMIGLICCSGLSVRICPISISDRITIFLHKKDGMK